MRVPQIFIISLLAIFLWMPLEAQDTAINKSASGFTGSTLPIFIIDTNGETILDEPKIMATMKIINNGPGAVNHMNDKPTDYDGTIGIEIRGASSSGYPQKPFAIETWDSIGMNNNVPLLGMPKENDWVLLSHYNEKTFMRNPISFYLFRNMGHYATRTKLVELVLNGSYEGIYLFGEKIKRDKNRVDIAEILPNNNSGDSLTGGYIFKTDYYKTAATWYSDYAPIHHPNYSTYFAHYYPKYTVITEYQKDYLKYAVEQFQYILHQPDFASMYPNFIDVPSFIDYFIISEVSRNVDAYKKSRYFYKDRDSRGGLICSGPVWDMDWAWKNIKDCEIFRNTDGSGWAYTINDCLRNPSPGWMTRLLEDTVFCNELKCRYTELRETILSMESIDSFIDSLFNLVSEPQVLHYERWDILGKQTGAPEIESPAQTYEEEVGRFRDWIALRLSWLDANMPGSAENCIGSTALETKFEMIFRIFPNPTTTDLYIESNSAIELIEIYSMSGNRALMLQPHGSYSVYLDTKSLDKGIYLVYVKTMNGIVRTEKIIKL